MIIRPFLKRTLSITAHSTKAKEKGGTNKIPKFEKVANIHDKITAAGTGHYVIARGQFSGQDELNRNIVLKVSKAIEVKNDIFKPEVIMDACLSDPEKVRLIDQLKRRSEVQTLSMGELDCIGGEDWNFGYIMSPYFSIFSKTQQLIHQNASTRELFHLSSRPGFVLEQKVWATDIESVFVRLGERPWLDQEIGLRLDRDQHTLFVHRRQVGKKINDNIPPTHEELRELMINTEWLVTAAAQLSYVISQSREEVKIPLFLPRIIQGTLNPWVEMKDSLWDKRLTAKLELSRKDYFT